MQGGEKIWKDYTVSPGKHGNSVTIFNLSTYAQLGCKINILRGCVPANQAEVDYSSISLLNSHVYWDTLYFKNERFKVLMQVINGPGSCVPLNVSK